VPNIVKEIDKGTSKASSGSSSSVSDTSFLNGADPVLTKPFMVGFTQAIDVIYWVGFGVLMLAFVLSWFFKAPPLRTRSALQEQADDAGVSETGTIRTQQAWRRPERADSRSGPPSEDEEHDRDRRGRAASERVGEGDVSARSSRPVRRCTRPRCAWSRSRARRHHDRADLPGRRRVAAHLLQLLPVKAPPP
jgi:hypothetical protein